MNATEQELLPQTQSSGISRPIEVGALSVIESQERANIDMLIATAKKYPRDLVNVKRNMEAMATLDQETAEACNYRLVREGHSIEGPGVRMAEIAVANYQNIRAGSRVLSNDGKVITGQAFCHDLENNTFVAWETQRRITDKHGRTYSEDMQVVTGNAAAAIAFRNAVFKVIPGALVRSVADKARAVAVGDLKTLTERRTRALKRFASIGVREDQILAFLGKTSADQIDIADVEKLFGIYTAIKDQSTTVEEQFPPVAISRAVQPNFETSKPEPAVGSQGTMVEQPLPMPEPAKRRGRPPKPVDPEPVSPSDAPPSEPEHNTPEPPSNAPESQPDDLVGEVKKRLAAERIPIMDFLILLQRNAYLEASREDIKLGHVNLDDVESGGLDTALKQWPEVVSRLKGAKE